MDSAVVKLVNVLHDASTLSFSVHVVMKKLCRSYQMMRKELHMIALVMQAYREIMVLGRQVQPG